ncbi:carotenoid oxygenase family protein [Actinomycetospora termitidis]|uniref:Dioxygenase n=1 Tax=Actinomycetospora termitidis TaxID=3053470 RepID=A0ABT7M2V1_9PSEU|nr:carotenoid oxygenase family protein [Actinomycetospora sp. Odt1-22]MDL5154990.1 carotenoid oxygenase family protein [Actinomycetospora sp. Odt1-22]
MTETADRPVYLAGRYAPVPDEIDAVDLPVEGTLPPELDGRYLRNGPNPLPGEDPGHWFLGHGMLHGVRLRGGRAEWYRNRWVRTGALAGRSMLGPDGVDLTAVVANTHVVEHAGRLLALVEGGLPYEVDADLGTVGPCDFDGRLHTAMTAHPKTDPDTGDLHFYGYSPVAPFLTYHRLSAAGELVVSRPVEVRGPTMMHDAAITAHHVVWLDLPMTFSWERLAQGMPFGWDEGYGARLGVMRHDDPTATVRWFEIEPCYVFHVGTAHEDAQGRIVLDAARYAPADAVAMWSGDRAATSSAALGRDAASRAAATGAARMHRWTLDPASGRVTETPLAERPVEFPTLSDALVGRDARYRYAVSSAGGRHAIVKLDVHAGTTTSHELGADVAAGEAVFVPAAGGTAEDDGWLLTITTRVDGSASQLLVLDASDVTRRVAAVTLPRGVPAGFHGSWVASPGEAT